MSYQKQNFVDGEVLYADNLNKIEDELVTKSSVYIQVAEPEGAENAMAKGESVVETTQKLVNGLPFDLKEVLTQFGTH